MVVTGQQVGARRHVTAAAVAARFAAGALWVVGLGAAALGVGALGAALDEVGAQPVQPGPARRPTADSDARTEIRTMLDASAAAWNRGDLDGFMTSYAPGEGTTFIGRRGILRGPAAIRASYAPRFAPGFARGTLHFEQLEIDLLAPGAANAIAYYVLTQPTASGADSTTARGPTSLVVRRLGGQWRIVHDHSS